MNQPPLIVGAGLAGLLAAHAWPTARVIDSAPGPMAAHKALLRFRSDAAAKLTGTEFRKVRVRKGIFDGTGFCTPTIALCNMYSHKTMRLFRDRSIWNLDSVDRYVAPEDWYERLMAAVGPRITWNCTHKANPELPPVVSTAPMPLTMHTYHILPADGFQRSPIRVRRWRIPDCDIYQTVYFPTPHTSIYRASITGSLLIVEETAHGNALEPTPLYWVERAFGLDPEALQPIDDVEQKYGKVDELAPDIRKAILFELTSRYNVYSLGRFATWRNILLDDVVEDIAVIKRLMNARNPYDLSKYASR